MDDRLLLVPPIWAPDPEVVGSWPAIRTFTDRLRDFLPVDFLRHPTLKGEERTGRGWKIVLGGYARAMTREHHVVILAAADEVALNAMAAQPPQSLSVFSFFPSPMTLAAIGQHELATVMELSFEGGKHPAQAIRAFMQGADDLFIRETVSSLMPTLDSAVLAEVIDDAQRTDFRPIGPIEIPALYIVRVSSLDARVFFELFQSYVPLARYDECQVWGTSLHEEAGGHELADKVIPFIEEVIAARGA
jgi:hypothetical protein